MLRYKLTCVIVLCAAWSQAQNTVDFTIPAEVCIGEVVSVVNNTPSGTDPRWSFCSITDGSHTGEANGSIAPSMSGLSIVEENGDWFGLAVTRDGLLFRVAFGSVPSNSGYTVTPLGNPGNLLTGSEWIHVIKEADKWYGLVTNADNDLVRLTWTSLLDNPQAQKLNLSSSGKLNGPTQVEIQKDGNDYVAIVANTGSNKLALVNFGNSMSNNPQSSDVISSPVLAGPLNMYGVSSYLMCGNWTIYTAVTDKLYRIDIGAHLFSAIDPAQITDVSADLPIAIGSYTRLKTIVDGVDASLYLTSYTTNLFARIIVPGDGSPLEFEDLSSTTQLGQLYTLEVYNYKNSLGIYVGSFGSGAVTNVKIETSCSASFHTSSEMVPKGLRYTQAGTYKISLTMTLSAGVVCSQEQEIVVKAQTSPDISFGTTNVCINHDVIFEAATASNEITMYQWNFGDGNSSTDIKPVHQFTTTGAFTTRLLVTASNGCTNSAERELKIYNVPAADFQLPTGLICTNNEFTFENATVGDFDGLVHFAWSVDGESAGMDRDLIYAFSEPGDYEIALTASIPGCENILARDLTSVMAGPAASFIISGTCEGQAIEFHSESSADAVGTSWNFGDGESASGQDVQHVFESGNYVVAFHAESNNGCVTTISKPLTIYSKPVPDFSIDHPPFSCAGSPSQFHDTTPAPIDSNVTSWLWSFGDGATSTGKNPTHIYVTSGVYSTGLTVTTDRGCKDQISKPVTIAPSPTASFVNGPTCMAKQTQFQGSTSGTAKSWFWKIGSATYAVQNPTHAFAAPGEYNVEMTVTAANNCVSTTTKKIVVPVVPLVDFSVSNTCAGQDAVFSAKVSGTPDLPAVYQWSFAGGAVATGQDVVRNFPSTGTQPVTLTSQHQSGCSYSTFRAVAIHPTPVASFVPTETYGASPLSVTFTSTSVDASAYEWRFDGGGEVTAASPTHVFSELGVHDITLKVTNAEGCSGNASGEAHVIVPHTDVAISGLDFVNEPSGNVRGVLTLTNNSNYPINAFDVTFETGSGVLVTEHFLQALPPQSEIVVLTTNSLSFSGNGSYVCISVIVPADEDLNNNRQCEPTGGESFVFEPYPNPSAGHVMLQVVSSHDETIEVSIANSSGANSYVKTIAAQRGLNVLDLDLTNLSPGVYVVRVISPSAAPVSRRIVLTRQEP